MHELNNRTPSWALQASLLSILDENIRKQLAKVFWHGSKPTETYFEFYREQCIEALADQGRLCSARTHQDIVNAAVLLVSEPRAAILCTLRAEYALREKRVSDDAVLRTIDLAARLSTMYRIGHWQSVVPGQNQLEWTSGHLQHCIGEHHRPELSTQVRFERLFDIVALQQVAGFKIIWTDDLTDHLAMHDLGMSQSVHIYHHAAFLNAQKSSAVFPPGLVDEALRTLALLFPHLDRRTRRFFKSEKLDEAVFSCGRLPIAERQLKRFHYFRDRLITLKEAFDDAEPSTITQWWHDRRKRVQWSTFWVAVMVLVLTVVFGLVQSIEGALQVYKAYYPTPSAQ